LASDALAIQIAFPSVGVTQSSFRLLGLPALPDKQKKTSNDVFFKELLVGTAGFEKTP
jgi:hypothetical protein